MGPEVLVSLAQPARRAVDARAPEVAMNFLRDWEFDIAGIQLKGVSPTKVTKELEDSNEIIEESIENVMISKRRRNRKMIEATRVVWAYCRWTPVHLLGRVGQAFSDRLSGGKGVLGSWQ